MTRVGFRRFATLDAVYFSVCLGGALSSAACSDVASVPSPFRSTEHTLRTSASAGKPGDSLYGCYVSEAVENAHFRYRYTRRELHFPQPALAPDRPPLEYRLRIQADGTPPIVVANCLIPRSPEAVRTLENVFHATGVRYTTPGHPQQDETISASIYEDPCNSRIGDNYDPKGTCFALDPVTGTAPPPSSPPPPPSPGAPISPGVGSGGGSGPCDYCSYNGSATFSCTPSVQRGGAVSCGIQAAKTSESSITVTSWTFRDALGRTVTSTDPTVDWNGVAVTGGNVTVQFDDGTGLREVSSSFAVSDRGWNWARNAESTYSDATGPVCYDHTPTYNRANGVNLPMGTGDCTPQRMVQPDSYTPAGDGFTAGTVTSGPNQGFHYIRTAKLYLRRQSSYNLGMRWDAPRVALQGAQQSACGDWANWFEYTLCAGYSPDAYIAGAHAHEGYGTTGHNGHFSAAYDAVADPGYDPMIFFDQQVGGNDIALDDFMNFVRHDFQLLAERADRATLDLALGGTIVTGNYSGEYCGWLPAEGRFLCAPSSPM